MVPKGVFSYSYFAHACPSPRRVNAGSRAPQTSAGNRSKFPLPRMHNKRDRQRQRALKSGKIVFAAGSFSVDCSIRNLSETGAKLREPTTVPIPDQFTLVDAHVGTRRQAKVVWRKGNQIGMRFEQS